MTDSDGNGSNPPPANETARLKAAFARDPRDLLGRVPGIAVLDKPPGPTSHDMVAAVRRELGMKRVGHAGTLDPPASGVLVILLGRATRLFSLTEEFDKEYEVAMRLGVATDTLDSAGLVVARADVPTLTDALIESALERFRGTTEQVPPMVSALKHEGQPLYKLARRGIEVPRTPRTVEVRELVLLGFATEEIRLRIVCSKGFYVRSLVDDVGKAMGTLATTDALRRTRVGPFVLPDACDIEHLNPAPFEG